MLEKIEIIIKDLKCILGKHDFKVVADDYKYNIKRCNHCNRKYEVHYKNLGMLYKCNHDQLPKAYRNL